MIPNDQAEAEMTEKFIQHHMRDDSRDSYVQNGQWAYGLGYRAGIKYSVLPPKREWIGLTEEEVIAVFKEKHALKFAQAIEAALKEKNT